MTIKESVPTETPQFIFLIDIIHPKNRNCRFGGELQLAITKHVEAPSLVEAQRIAVAGETCSSCGYTYEVLPYCSTA